MLNEEDFITQLQLYDKTFRWLGKMADEAIAESKSDEELKKRLEPLRNKLAAEIVKMQEFILDNQGSE